MLPANLFALSRFLSVSTSVCLGEEKRWVPWSAIRITQTKSAGFGNKNSKTAPRAEIRRVRVSWKKCIVLEYLQQLFVPRTRRTQKTKKWNFKTNVIYWFQKKVSTKRRNLKLSSYWGVFQRKKHLLCALFPLFFFSECKQDHTETNRLLVVTKWKRRAFSSGNIFYPFFHLRAV